MTTTDQMPDDKRLARLTINVDVEPDGGYHAWTVGNTFHGHSKDDPYEAALRACQAFVRDAQAEATDNAST